MNRIALLPLAFSIACVEAEMDVETAPIRGTDVQTDFDTTAVDAGIGITGGPIARIDTESDPFAGGFDVVGGVPETQERPVEKPLNRVFDPDGYCATDTDVERACPAITDEVLEQNPQSRAALVELSRACERFMTLGPDHYAMEREEVVTIEGTEDWSESVEHSTICNGQVAEAFDILDEGTVPPEDAGSIDKAFHIIAELMTYPDVELEVSYDSNMGAPTDIMATRIEDGQLVRYGLSYTMMPIGEQPE